MSRRQRPAAGPPRLTSSRVNPPRSRNSRQRPGTTPRMIGIPGRTPIQKAPHAPSCCASSRPRLEPGTSLTQALAAKQVPDAVSQVGAGPVPGGRAGRRRRVRRGLGRIPPEPAPPFGHGAPPGAPRQRSGSRRHRRRLAAVDADDEYAAALDLARRRQRSMDQLPREVQYRRLAGMLGRRGFGPGATARVLAEVLGLSESRRSRPESGPSSPESGPSRLRAVLDRDIGRTYPAGKRYPVTPVRYESDAGWSIRPDLAEVLPALFFRPLPRQSTKWC